MLRSLFIGVGAFALVAIGIHAAADCLDDRIFAAVEALDEWVDHQLARTSFTQPWIDLVGARSLTTFSRSLAMSLELVLDFVIGFSVFAYEQRVGVDHSVSALAREAMRRPTTHRGDGPRLIARFTRPALALCFVLAGANAVGRLAQGSLELGLRAKLGGWSTLLGRIGGLWTLGACIVVLGVDAVAATFARADDSDSARGLGRELTVLAVAMPLAYFAVTESIAIGAYLK